MAPDLPELMVADAAARGAWLGNHHGTSTGVWLALAKKGTSEPTRLNYDEALEEALCHGWIDGQLGRRDEATHRQRFTPRRVRSAWSRRNVALAERLMGEGRMQPPGLAEVKRARVDGRWDSAYAGSGEIEVPADVADALQATPGVRATFDRLSSASRYSILSLAKEKGPP
jgi:uncharacterized protein YdeI (YjbR/CyaY-like superfamily)